MESLILASVCKELGRALAKTTHSLPCPPSGTFSAQEEKGNPKGMEQSQNITKYLGYSQPSEKKEPVGVGRWPGSDWVSLCTSQSKKKLPRGTPIHSILWPFLGAPLYFSQKAWLATSPAPLR